jgi:hypothetical protein
MFNRKNGDLVRETMKSFAVTAGIDHHLYSSQRWPRLGRWR